MMRRLDSRPAVGAERLRLPEPAVDLPISISALIRKLRPNNFGRKKIHLDEIRLHSLYSEIKSKLKPEDHESKNLLLKMFKKYGNNTRIEEFRRLTILVLLEQYLYDPVVLRVIRREYLKILHDRDKRSEKCHEGLDFSFALNTQSGRAVIQLSAELCSTLTSLDEKNRNAYLKLKEFADSLSTEDREKIDWGTAQLIDYGSKRDVFRVQYEGRNAVLILGYQFSFTKRMMEEERDLYALFRSLELKIIKIPDVYAVVGKLDNAALIMEDCSKGGNARLKPIKSAAEVPSELKESLDLDLAVLDAHPKSHDLFGLSCIYLQTNRKTGEKQIFILDAENLL